MGPLGSAHRMVRLHEVQRPRAGLRLQRQAAEFTPHSQKPEALTVNFLLKVLVSYFMIQQMQLLVINNSLFMEC